jgi:hypothetical protein
MKRTRPGRTEIVFVESVIIMLPVLSSYGKFGFHRPRHSVGGYCEISKIRSQTCARVYDAGMSRDFNPRGFVSRSAAG